MLCSISYEYHTIRSQSLLLGKVIRRWARGDYQAPPLPIPNYRAANFLLWYLWPCNSALYVLNDVNWVSNERWVFYLLYQQNLKQNNHPLTNCCHISYPTPQMYIRTKNVFFTVFFIDTCLMINFITNWHRWKVLILSLHLITKLCGWGCYLHGCRVW